MIGPLTAPKPMTRRLSTIGLLFVITLLMVTILRRPYLNDADEIAATTALTEWALGLRNLPGNDQALYDLRFFADKKIVLTYVGCKPPVNQLHYTERRASIVSSSEARAMRQSAGYDSNAYIMIERLKRTRTKITYTVTIAFARLGGEGYDFEITKTNGLRFCGSLAWVS